MEKANLDAVDVSKLSRKASVFNFEFTHKRQQSLESLYASVQSISVSISDGSSSADSVAVGRIQNINKDLMEKVNSRLTAFLYFNEMNQNSVEDSLISSISSLENMKQFISTELEGVKDGEQKFLVVSQILRQISDLQKIHQDELDKLKGFHEEIYTLNTEECELNDRLQDIEKKCNRLVLEEHGEKTACGCSVF